MKRMRPGIVWLSIAAVALAAVCIYRRGRHSLFCAEWMHVSTVDENGNQIGSGKWYLIPKPDNINSSGLSLVSQYVTRMLNSPNAKCSLIIASADGSAACLVMRDGSQPMLKEHIMLGSSSRRKGYRNFDLPPQAPEFEKEAKLRRLFLEIGIEPNRDFVHDYNGYTNAMRELEFPIGNDISQITTIIQRLLREVYHVKEEDGLDFLFQES